MGQAATSHFGGGEFSEIIEWSDNAVVIFDASLTIVTENRVMLAISRRSDGNHKDQLLLQAYPELAGTMVEVHIRHTVATGEPSSIDMPSPFAPGAWLAIRTFPIGANNALVMRNISAEVLHQQNALAKETLLGALFSHGGVGHVQVSVRGVIERADPRFCDMIGLPEERLLKIPMADLVDRSERASFRIELDRVLNGEPGQSTLCRLLDNKGADVQVRLGMAPLRGPIGIEGAVIISTRKAEELA